MYGFFKKFLRLVAEYVDRNTLYAVGRSTNTTLTAYQFKLNEKKSEARLNSPIPDIEQRYNVDVHTHHEKEENTELDPEMLEYIHEPKTKEFKDANHQLRHDLYQRHTKKLRTSPDRPD